MTSAQQVSSYYYCPNGEHRSFFCADGPQSIGGNTVFYIDLGGIPPSSCTASGSPDWNGNLRTLIKRMYPTVDEKIIDSSNRYSIFSFTIPVSKKTLFSLDCKEKIGAFEVGSTGTLSSGPTKTLQEMCAQKVIPNISCTRDTDCVGEVYTGICGRAEKVTADGHQTLVRFCQKKSIEKVCPKETAEKQNNITDKGVIPTKQKSTEPLIPPEQEEILKKISKEANERVTYEENIKIEQKKSGVYDRLENKIKQGAREKELTPQRRVLGVERLTDSVEKKEVFPIYKSSDNPDPNKKLDILFVGMKKDWDVGSRSLVNTDNEFKRFVSYITGRGFHMYSPYRENITRMSIWGTLLDRDFTGDNRGSFADLTSEFGVDKVILISKEDFRSYANWDGAAYLSLPFQNKEKDTRIWSEETKNNFTATLMHEFGHSFGGLADEYLEKGKSNSWRRPNCIKEGEDNDATGWWFKNSGNQDWRYSQSGKIPVTAGNFTGCAFNDENTRPTDDSIMKNQWKFEYAFGWNVYPHYGWISTTQLQNRLNAYNESFSGSSCGEIGGWACGGSQPGINDGQFCYDFAAMVHEGQGNVCRACGGSNELRCNGTKNGMVEGCSNPNEPQSDGICRHCGEYNEPSCKKSKDGMKNGCLAPHENSGFRSQESCDTFVSSEYWKCKDRKESDCWKLLSDWNNCGNRNTNKIDEGVCQKCSTSSIYQGETGRCISCGNANQPICGNGADGIKNGCFKPYARTSENKCMPCLSGTIYDSGRCVQCGDNAQQVCAIWDTSGMILGCKPPYVPKDGTCTPKQKGNGLVAEYFEGRNFEKLKAVTLNKTIDFNWGGKAPVEGVREHEFSVRWKGEIEPRYSEEYTFTVEADDGVRVWIGGSTSPLIDKWLEQDTSWTGKTVFKAGQKYPIQLEYFQGKWGSRMKLYWQSKSQVKEIVPTSALFSDESLITQRPRIYYFRANGEYQPNRQITIEPHETVTLEWKADADTCSIAEVLDGKKSQKEVGTFTWGTDYTPKRYTTYTLTCKNKEKTAEASLAVNVIQQFPCDFNYFKKNGKMTCGHIEWKADPSDVVFKTDPIPYLMKYDKLYTFYADFMGYEPLEKKLIISTHSDYVMSASWPYHRINLTPDFLRDHLAVIAGYPEKPLASSLMHEMGHIFTLIPPTKNAYMWHAYTVEPYGDIGGVMAYLWGQQSKKEGEKLYWDGWCGKKNLSSPCRNYFTTIEEYFSVNPSEEKYKTFFKNGGSFESFYSTAVTGYNHEHASIFTHMILDVYRDFDHQGKGAQFYEAYRQLMHFYTQKADLFPEGWLREDTSYPTITKKSQVFVYLLSFFTRTDLSSRFETWKWPLSDRTKIAIKATLQDPATMETNFKNLVGKQTPAPAGSGTGLSGAYYNGTGFNTLVRTQTDKNIDVNWGLNAPIKDAPANQFSIRWKGQIQPRFSDEYTFSTVADDGVRLWVNKTLLIQDWTVHGPTEKSGKIFLEAGKKYDITLEYYDDQWGAEIHLSWSSENQTKEIIPTTQLYPPPQSRRNTQGCPEGAVKIGNSCVFP